MPFDLKYVGVTFQQAMNYVFHDLAYLILAYLDDLMAKSNKWYQHLELIHIMFYGCQK